MKKIHSLYLTLSLAFILSTTPLQAASSEPLMQEAVNQSATVEKMAAEIATELSAACPFTAPNKTSAFEGCKQNLLASKSVIRTYLPPFVLWGRIVDPKLTLKDTHLTQFGPDVFLSLYLPLFMFDGKHDISFDKAQRLHRIDYSAAFRNRLAPGQYPYPFWHLENKWGIYQGANTLTVWVDAQSKTGSKIKAMQFSTFGKPNVGQPALVPTPEFTPEQRAWLWTDSDGKTQPMVTLFDSLYSAHNPHLKALDTTYRNLALDLRAGDCMGCHVPNNPDKMKRLVLLQTPVHAQDEIGRLIKSVSSDRMPIDEIGTEKALDSDVKARLLKNARAFESAIANARAWEATKAKN